MLLTILPADFSLATPSLFEQSYPTFKKLHKDAEQLGITTVTQSSSGLIWLGTDRGIYQYDGHKFKQVDYLNAEGNKLKPDYIYTIREGKKGVLWVATFSSGLVRIDEENRSFTVFGNSAEDSNFLNGGNISEVLPEENGVWIGADNGLFYFNDNDKSVNHFELPGLKRKNIRVMHRHSNGSLYLGTYNGVYIFNEEDHSVSLLAGTSGSEESSFSISTIAEGSNGEIWISDYAKGIRLVELDGSRTDFPEYGKVYDILVNEQEVWLPNYEKGIYVLDAKSRKLKTFIQADEYRLFGVDSNEITRLFKDQSGLIWALTWRAGAWIISPSYKYSKSTVFSPIQKNNHTRNDYNSVITRNDSEFWAISDSGGVDVFSLTEGFVKNIPLGSDQPIDLPSQKIHKLMKTQSGNIWLLTKNFDFYHYQAIGPNSWRRSQCELGGLKDKMDLSYRQILLADGSMVSADRGGLFLVKQSNTACYVEEIDLGKSVYPSSVVAISEKDLIVFDNNRIFSYNLDLKKTEKVVLQEEYQEEVVTWAKKLNSAEVHLYSLDNVFTFKSLQDKTLIIEKFNDTYKPPGFYHKDKHGNYWGQYSYRLAGDEHSRDLALEDGAIQELGELKDFAIVNDDFHVLLFAKGFRIFQPSKFEAWTYQPPLTIQDISVDGDSVLGSLKTFTLTPEKSDFSISFLALDYSDPTALRYRYKLKGYSNEWVDESAEERKASFTNIPPGEYQFILHSTNRRGDWSDYELVLPISVLPAWFETAWFYAALTILSLLLFYCLLRWRVSYYRNKKIELEGLVQRRTKDLQKSQASLMRSEKQASLGRMLVGMAHEINTPLGVVRMASSVMEKNASELFAAFNMTEIDDKQISSRLGKVSGSSQLLNSNLERLSNLVNKFKKVSADEREWAFTQVDVASMVNNLQNQFSDELESTGIILETHCENHVSVYSSATLLNEILNELLDNAINHAFTTGGGNKKISVRLCQSSNEYRDADAVKGQDKGGSVIIYVDDNGQGIAEDLMSNVFDPFTAAKTNDVGLGLHVLANLINIVLGGTIEYQKLEPGSRFKVNIPCQKYSESSGVSLQDYKEPDVGNLSSAALGSKS